jgi:hypothetical protein
VTRLLRSCRRSPWPLAGGLGLLALLPIEGLAGAALRCAALLGAMAALASGLRGRAPAAAGGRLAIAGRSALTRDCGIVLLEADGRRLLVGYAPSGVAVLADLSAAAPVAAPGAQP